MSGSDTNATLTEAVNKHGTPIRIGQQWEDNSPTRDPIRQFTITGLGDVYGSISATCHITHGIDRNTGAQVPIDRTVTIAIDRLRPVRTGYRQIQP